MTEILAIACIMLLIAMTFSFYYDMKHKRRMTILSKQLDELLHLQSIEKKRYAEILSTLEKINQQQERLVHNIK